MIILPDFCHIFVQNYSYGKYVHSCNDYYEAIKDFQLFVCSLNDYFLKVPNSISILSYTLIISQDFRHKVEILLHLLSILSSANQRIANKILSTRVKISTQCNRNTSLPAAVIMLTLRTIMYC